MASIDVTDRLGDDWVTERVNEPDALNRESTTPLTVKVKGPAVQPRFRYRIVFEKKGPLRFISHNDLMRTWDRLLRRTALPLKLTEGFHAKLKVSSPLSLAVGLEATEEIFDFELTAYSPGTLVETLVREQSIPGLNIVSVTELSPTATSKSGSGGIHVSLSGRNERIRSGESDRRTSLRLIMLGRTASNGQATARIDIRPKMDSIAAAGNSYTCASRGRWFNRPTRGGARSPRTRPTGT